MKSKKFLALALAAISVGTMAAFASCGEGGTSTGGNGGTQTVRISGSSSVTPLMQELAAAYMAVNEGITIDVQQSDSSAGIQDAINGTSDIGMASRDLHSNETSSVVSQKIATDGVALVVGTGCTVTNVTMDEVYDLYAKGTPIQTVITGGYNREPGSGTRSAFTELIEKDGHALDEIDTFPQCIQEASSTDQMKTSIAGSTNLIGYLSLGALDDTIKAVNFEGVEATAANVANGSYTLSRPFNIVYTSLDDLSDAAKAFIDFIMSDAGQEIVAEKGYIEVA